MSLKQVLIANKTFPAAGLELLKDKVNITIIPYLDYEPQILPEIKKHIKGKDAVIWNTKHCLSADTLDIAGPQLTAITTMASGFDQFDVEAIKSRGLRFGNTPNVLNAAVADLAVGLMIAAARRFKEGVRELESGKWKYGVQWTLGQDIKNSTVGIIGLGGIGQSIVRRLQGFEVARFIYTGRNDKPEAKALNVQRVSLAQLLKESDFVHVCCPLSKETRHLINKDTLQLMKRNAVILNIGRGGVIDQKALYEALKNGTIFAAGLDVTTPEPLHKDDPIVQLPNCYILPHLGSTTINTRNAMAKISAKNILLALEGKPMLHPIC